jgi:hypothetical protein
MADRPPRTVVVVLIVLVVGAVAAAAAYGLHSLWQTAKQHFASDSCTVGGYDLDTDQAAVASTMVGAVTQYKIGHSRRATVLVLAAGLQESKLTNIPPDYGDRDSVGVLQQRPSQGWGHVDGKPDSIAARKARLTDVGEATREFLAHLANVPHWPTLPLADAVQAVQISADGSAYAQHEPEAQALARALRGLQPAGVECSFGAPTKVADPATVASQAGDQLGIATPQPNGQTVRVPGAGWQTAAWFVANADRLGIEQVAYSGRQWTRDSGKWQNSNGRRGAVTATMYQKS